MNKKIFYLMLLLPSLLAITIFIYYSVEIPGYKGNAQLKSAGMKSADTEISITAVGDVSFSRGVEWVVKNQKDINYPFLKIREQLKGDDIVFANLETPITGGREMKYGEMIFRSNPGTENALKEAGFNLVSLANNHTPDFGDKGLTDTLKYLDEAGIKHAGAGISSDNAYKPEYIEVKGIKLAFLAFTDPTIVPGSYEAGEKKPGTAFMKTDKLIEELKGAKNKSDLQIISMHGGTEYTNKPNELQINFAHTAIDNGADLVIGHHPHVVQTVEKYKDKLIFYSLGNFVFDQMWSQQTREGLILKAILNKNGIKSFTLLPIVIENYSQPRPATDVEKERILKRLNYSPEKEQ